MECPRLALSFLYRENASFELDDAGKTLGPSRLHTCISVRRPEDSRATRIAFVEFRSKKGEFDKHAEFPSTLKNCNGQHYCSIAA